jgi:hypothetical protein
MLYNSGIKKKPSKIVFNSLDFVIAFWIMIYVSHIVNFTILYQAKLVQNVKTQFYYNVVQFACVIQYLWLNKFLPQAALILSKFISLWIYYFMQLFFFCFLVFFLQVEKSFIRSTIALELQPYGSKKLDGYPSKFLLT